MKTHTLRITRNKTSGAIRIWDGLKGQFVGSENYETKENAEKARDGMERRKNEKDLLDSLGMKKVKGNLGGTYYE